MAEQTWKSSSIKDFWRHEYLTVHFDKHAPGQLIVTRDWKQTLTDAGNYDFVTSRIYIFALFWLGFMLAVVVLTGLISLPGRWPLRMQGQSILAQAIVLIPTLALMGFAASLVTHEDIMLTLAILIYLGSAWPDRWIFNRFSRQTYSNAWRLIMFTKLAIIALLLAGWWLLGMDTFGGVG